METPKFAHYPGLINEINQHATRLALEISDSINKAWLAKRLGITFPTLCKRLSDNRWKPEQVEQLQKLHSNLF